MTRVRLCCVKLSLATRVIAMVEMITSVLVMTQLASELLERDGSDGGTVSILLGLDIDEFQSMSGKNKPGIEIMIPFIVFALIYAVASALLVWGSIVERSWCAIPWLICEAVSFVAQIVTLALHGITPRTAKDKWIILLSIFNIGLSIYFWLVVFFAQRVWARQKREEKENETNSTTSITSRNMEENIFEPTSSHEPQIHV